MKLDILVNDGSPMGVVPSDILGEGDRVGVGGAELALFTMCETWAQRGHDVRLYNDPRRIEKEIDQRPLRAFNKTDRRDVLIIFRSPNTRAESANGMRVWWSHDYRTVGSFRDFSAHTHKIVLSSEFHKKHFCQAYGIDTAIVIDLPVRSWEYEERRQKVPRQLLFSSVPLRGLDVVARVYPAIRREVPDTSLVITSDYRLWGVESSANYRHVATFASMPGVRYLGAVPRRRLVEEQLKSDILLYPSTYDELFCIAVAEAQVSGALPITSGLGALTTTNMGVVVEGDPRDPGWQATYIMSVVSHLTNGKLLALQKQVAARAMERFNSQAVATQWDERIFT